jgi:DNA primase catalytic subunit
MKRTLLHEINNARQMLNNAVELIKMNASLEEISKQVWRAAELCMDCDSKITNEICRLEEESWDCKMCEKLANIEKYIKELDR